MKIFLSRFLVVGVLFPVAVWSQHDPGRNAVRKLALDGFDAAEELIAKEGKANNSPIDQAERHFVMALSASMRGDGAESLSQAKLAVEQGAEFGRFLAGPEDAFSALYQVDGFSEWAESFELELVHGPMIGEVTAESANVWLRTAEPMSVAVTLSGDRDERTLRLKTQAGRDDTAVARFTGLKPLTDYGVTVAIGGRVVGKGAFRTTARQGEPGKMTMVLGGGAGFTPQYERMWETIEKQKPDAMFLLGDNVYIDDPTHVLTHHYIYYRRQSQPQWRSLVSKTPTYAIYDDHDFGLNDCNPGPFIERPKWKREAWSVFSENWANPYYGGGDTQPGCWFDTYIGDVHFICLDGRYYRDRDGGSMIGPVQKEWLLRTLKESKGMFKVLASPVPWSPGVKPGSSDTWDGFAAEREEIFGFINEHKIDGVVLIAADRHRVDVRKTNRPEGYDLYEIMSSRLTNVHTHGLVENAKGSEFVVGYNETPAFAKLEFDTEATPPMLTCVIVDIDDRERGRFQVSADQLRH